MHFLYNIFGVLIFAAIPFLWRLPVKSAEWLGNMVAKSRMYAIGYIVGVFFVLPACVLGVQAIFGNKEQAIIEAEADEAKLDAVEAEVEKSEFAIE